MRSRTLVSIIALLGVLLHAGALVRHNTTMLGAHLQHRSLIADLGQLCQGGGTASSIPAADQPAIPQPTDAQNGCPLCSGLGTAFALLAPELAAILLPAPAAPIFHAVPIDIPELPHAAHPPARGPPARA